MNTQTTWSPESFYQKRIVDIRKDKIQLNRKSKICFYGKLITFAAAIFSVYWGIQSDKQCFIVLGVIVLLIYICLLIIDSRWQDQLEQLTREEHICENETAAMHGDFSAFGNGREYLDANHPYAFDLDLFGLDSLYQRLNRCVTRKGADRLAEKFCRLKTDATEITDSQKAIEELKGLPEWRIRFQARPFIECHLEQLAQAVQAAPHASRFSRSMWPYVLVSATLVSLLSAIANLCSWIYFDMLFVFQLLLVFLQSKKAIHSGIQAEQLYQEFKGYQNLMEQIQKQPFKSARLQRLHKELFTSTTSCSKSFCELSRILNLMDQQSSGLIYILFNGLFLYDILLMRRFTNWCRQYLPHVHDWLETLGEIDALTSLATYAFNHPENTYAILLPDNSETVFRATALYHPFLSAEQAVPNDFELSRKNIALVTGANMAGKSTFLRTVGVNYVLAHTGAPVCARSFQMAVVSLFSSMRTTDNLSADVSYFHAELIRLKQLLLHIQNHPYTLVILDEILKGTNSQDKLKGSRLFLEELARYPVSALVATHDLELAALKKKNPQQYRNYCFEIELSDEIQYSYRIQQGVAKNLNASYLLQKVLEEVNVHSYNI